jgi:uncharacterized protein (TIGR03083 family)
MRTGEDAGGGARTGTVHDIAAEYTALAALLEAADPAVWDAPSLCEGWRTREVVAHMTMPARYDGPAFMAELEASDGDFTLDDLRSPVLHTWQPPGGGEDGALVHCVIHTLDIVEAVPLDRRVPAARIRLVLGMVTAGAAGTPNLFGLDLSAVELRADDLEWSSGSGALVTGPAQVLALAACGRLLPPGRLHGEAAPRFSRP